MSEFDDALADREAYQGVFVVAGGERVSDKPQECVGPSRTGDPAPDGAEAVSVPDRPARRRGRPAKASATAGPFGARLRELREAAGLTRNQLADLAGLHPKTVEQLERGRDPDAAEKGRRGKTASRRPCEPNLTTLRALASALGLDVSRLLV